MCNKNDGYIQKSLIKFAFLSRLKPIMWFNKLFNTILIKYYCIVINTLHKISTKITQKKLHLSHLRSHCINLRSHLINLSPDCINLSPLSATAVRLNLSRKGYSEITNINSQSVSAQFSLLLILKHLFCKRKRKKGLRDLGCYILALLYRIGGLLCCIRGLLLGIRALLCRIGGLLLGIRALLCRIGKRKKHFIALRCLIGKRKKPFIALRCLIGKRKNLFFSFPAHIIGSGRHINSHSNSIYFNCEYFIHINQDLKVILNEEDYLKIHEYWSESNYFN